MASQSHETRSERELNERHVSLQLQRLSDNTSHGNITSNQDSDDRADKRKWPLVAACAIITWWFVGITYSWGILQGALVDQGLSSSATLAFVGSLTVTCISAFAVINARIVLLLGLRTTALIGISLLGFGGICSGFATHSVVGMFLTTGLTMGLGTSLCFMVISIAPAQYFGRKRGLANGIVYGAGGLGGAVISLSLDALIDKYSISWAFWIVGILTLVTGLPAAWIVKQRGPIQKAAMIDRQLFRDRGFILLFLGCAIATFPLFVAPFFLPLYTRAIHLPSSTGAALVSSFNFSSAVGRILCGLLCDTIGPLNTLFLALSLSSVSMLVIWPVSASVGPLAVFSIINGAANGGFFSTIPTIASNTYGSTRVSVVMGMIVTGWIGGYLLGAPIAGYLLTAFGGEEQGLQAFRPAIYFAGSMTLGASGLVASVRLRTSTRLLVKV